MAEQKTAHRISSFTAPTDADLAFFEGLAESEKRELLRTEIGKGFTGSLSGRSFDEIVASARARFEVRSRDG